MVWIGFFVSIFVLLYLSRTNLALGLFAAALTLGIFTSSPQLIWTRIYLTFSDPSIVYLSIVVFFMPLIGGILEESGQMDDLVQNMRIAQLHPPPFCTNLLTNRGLLFFWPFC